MNFDETTKDGLTRVYINVNGCLVVEDISDEDSDGRHPSVGMGPTRAGAWEIIRLMVAATEDLKP